LSVVVVGRAGWAGRSPDSNEELAPAHPGLCPAHAPAPVLRCPPPCTWMQASSALSRWTLYQDD
jgi:hypothetical protein